MFLDFKTLLTLAIAGFTVTYFAYSCRRKRKNYPPGKTNIKFNINNTETESDDCQ